MPGQADMQDRPGMIGKFGIISDKSILECRGSSDLAGTDTVHGTRRGRTRNRLQFVNAYVGLTGAGTTCLNYPLPHGLHSMESNALGYFPIDIAHTMFDSLWRGATQK